MAPDASFPPAIMNSKLKYKKAGEITEFSSIQTIGLNWDYYSLLAYFCASWIRKGKKESERKRADERDEKKSDKRDVMDRNMMG